MLPYLTCQEKTLYFAYQIFIGLLFYLSFPFLLLIVLMTGKHRQGLRERLGMYRKIPRQDKNETRIWLHAASVGEVRAAGAIINALQGRLPQARFFLSTMTIHGKRVAAERLSPEVYCFLAPLDVPLVVDRVLDAVNPDIYVCIETEIWPLLIHKIASHGVKAVLVNGRMSENSYRNYKRIRWLIAGVLRQFHHIAVITEADRRRYLAVGADERLLSVEGNVKYDLSPPQNTDALKHRYRSVLRMTDKSEALITGSTHTGEEELLLPLYRSLAVEKELLWILAPRHLDRLPQIEAMFKQQSLAFDRFSELLGGKIRTHKVVIIDSLGELAGLYAVATYVFCGGSLVDRGGHNVMEAAIWGKPVFFGPSMGDFRDAVELLESASAGFRVEDARQLEEKIRFFRDAPEAYQEACLRAGDIAGRQAGAAERQVRIILQCLKGSV
jgi:3-deoxy-D-manno-octulosonic-acid transferase